MRVGLNWQKLHSIETKIQEKWSKSQRPRAMRYEKRYQMSIMIIGKLEEVASAVLVEL